MDRHIIISLGQSELSLTGLSTLSANFISVCSFWSFSSGVGSVRMQDRKTKALNKPEIYLNNDRQQRKTDASGSYICQFMWGSAFKPTFLLLYFLLWRPLWFASGFFRLSPGRRGNSCWPMCTCLQWPLPSWEFRGDNDGLLYTVYSPGPGLLIWPLRFLLLDFLLLSLPYLLLHFGLLLTVWPLGRLFHLGCEESTRETMAQQ